MRTHVYVPYLRVLMLLNVARFIVCDFRTYVRSYVRESECVRMCVHVYVQVCKCVFMRVRVCVCLYNFIYHQYYIF